MNVPLLTDNTIMILKEYIYIENKKNRIMSIHAQHSEHLSWKNKHSCSFKNENILKRESLSFLYCWQQRYRNKSILSIAYIKIYMLQDEMEWNYDNNRIFCLKKTSTNFKIHITFLYLYVFITCVNCKIVIFSSVLLLLHFTQLRKMMKIKRL